MAIIIKKRVVVAPPPEPVRQMPEMLDGELSVIMARSPRAAISWWLMAAWTYEVHALSIISDAKFDEISKFIAEHYDELDHSHKHLIHKDFTKSAVGVKFPLLTQYAAMELVKSRMGVRLGVSE